MSAEHRRRYRLCAGVAVEFVFRPGDFRKGQVSSTGLCCEWDPALPRFPPGNAKNKFLRRYRVARDDFLTDIAQIIGGPILNVDTDTGEMTEFVPQVPS